MLEIFLVVYLSKKIGKILEEKGHKKGWYIAIFVVTWFASEIAGMLIGAVLFENAPVLMYVIALLGAGAAYIANYYFAKSLPDLTLQGGLHNLNTTREEW